MHHVATACALIGVACARVAEGVGTLVRSRFCTFFCTHHDLWIHFGVGKRREKRRFFFFLFSDSMDASVTAHWCVRVT